MTKRPRVLHVVESLIAGVSSAVADYVSHDIAEHVVLAHSRGTLVDERLTAHASAFFELPMEHTRRLALVRAVIRDVQPDVVHAHSSLAGVYVRLSRFPRDRIVYSPHCFAFERRDIGPLTRRFLWLVEASLARRTGSFAVVSEREGRLARALSKRTPIHVIPHAPIARAVRPADGAPRGSGPLQIVTSGRVSRQKDPDFFVQAARSDANNGGVGRWKWIGGGDPGLERVLRDGGVEVTGLLPRDQAMGHLEAADVYVHTALWEGFPISVLEAGAAGIAVIVRDIPALQGTALTSVRTPDELASAVRSMSLAEHWTRARRAAVTLAAQHTREAQLQALTKLYSEARR